MVRRKKGRDEGRKEDQGEGEEGKGGAKKNEIQETRAEGERREKRGGERPIPWVNLTCSHRDTLGSSRIEGKKSLRSGVNL